MNREFKSTPFASFKKDKLGARQRAGIFAVCGNVDSGGDRIQAGAFGKTFAEQKGRVRFLWNHNFNQVPIATVDDLYEISAADLPDEVRAFAPEATGGAVVVRTYLDTEDADKVLTALDAGAINEMSFAYEAVKREYVTDVRADGSKRDVREIKEVRMYEASDVNWGMNPATVGLMSFPMEAIKSLGAQIKSGELDKTALLGIVDDLKALLASIEQPKTDSENIPAPTIHVGAQLQHAKARLSLLEASL